MKKVVLDENLDRRLKNYFSAELNVTSVPDLGWQSKKNGELLSAMKEAGFDYVVTADRNLRYQQNLDKYGIKVVVLITFDTRLKYLSGSVDQIENAILAASATENILEVDLREL